MSKEIKPELKIEANDLGRDTPVNPKTLEVKIFDGDQLVAETTLESLVTKFLMVSAEYTKVMAAITAVKEDGEAIPQTHHESKE